MSIENPFHANCIVICSSRAFARILCYFCRLHARRRGAGAHRSNGSSNRSFGATDDDLDNNPASCVDGNSLNGVGSGGCGDSAGDGRSGGGGHLWTKLLNRCKVRR